MDETPAATSGSRRNEDIALDLMKFVAMTTGYGRTSSIRSRLSGQRRRSQAGRVCRPPARAIWEVFAGGCRERSSRLSNLGLFFTTSRPLRSKSSRLLTAKAPRITCFPFSLKPILSGHCTNDLAKRKMCAS